MTTGDGIPAPHFVFDQSTLPPCVAPAGSVRSPWQPRAIA